MLKGAVLALAAALTLMGSSAAAARADPVSRVAWSSGTGTVLCLSLGSPAKPPFAGEAVVVATCSATRADQNWDFTGGVLVPYGSSLAVRASRLTGLLHLTAKAGTVWTYGPGHTLSAPGPSGQEFLAYTGTGGHPVLGGAGSTIWYVFTQGP